MAQYQEQEHHDQFYSDFSQMNIQGDGAEEEMQVDIIRVSLKSSYLFRLVLRLPTMRSR